MPPPTPADSLPSGQAPRAVAEGKAQARKKGPANREGKFRLHVRRVLLDAGHGGRDPGTHHNGILERTVTLDLAKRVGAILAAHDIDVKYTRFSNRWVSLDARPTRCGRRGRTCSYPFMSTPILLPRFRGSKPIISISRAHQPLHGSPPWKMRSRDVRPPVGRSCPQANCFASSSRSRPGWPATFRIQRSAICAARSTRPLTAASRPRRSMSCASRRAGRAGGGRLLHQQAGSRMACPASLPGIARPRHRLRHSGLRRSGIGGAGRHPLKNDAAASHRTRCSG